MPRSLSMQRTVVTPGDRPKYLQRMQARKAHYTASGCQFWVFEEAALSGAFIEFTEASSAEALRAAHASAAEPPLDPARIYTIVELP